MLEYFFQCPHCWEQISFLLDTSERQLNYVEDCEVCCNPIEINATFNEDQLVSFESNSLEQ